MPATHRFTCRVCGLSWLGRIDVAARDWQDQDWYHHGQVVIVEKV